MNDKEEPKDKLPPAVDEALTKLTEIFSDPSLHSKARLRCGTEGPDEFDVLFESIIDDQFGHDPNSEYKQWVRRLYRLGLISAIPSEWATSEKTGRSELVGSAGDVRLSNDLGRGPANHYKNFR
jgi:hypothetical protein